MPSKRATLAFVALLALAGCSATSDPGSTATSEATSAPETTPPAPTTTSPKSTEAPIPAAEVLDYRDLPNGTQRLVRIALENGSVRRDYDAFVGFSQAEGESHEYLRYDGTTYDVEWENHMRAEYFLESVEPANVTEADQDRGVVAYENLSARGQRLFDQVRREGNYSRAYELEAFPEALRLNAYVSYEGQYYRTVVLHSDIGVWELRLQPVDRGHVEG